jgi:hypothetical protein
MARSASFGNAYLSKALTGVLASLSAVRQAVVPEDIGIDDYTAIWLRIGRKI